jgi:hypothetical protein
MRRQLIGAVLVVVLVYAAFLVAAFGAGMVYGRNHAPKCHSATEDSVILDCDYRHGAWHPK